MVSETRVFLIFLFFLSIQSLLFKYQVSSTLVWPQIALPALQKELREIGFHLRMIRNKRSSLFVQKKSFTTLMTDQGLMKRFVHH